MQPEESRTGGWSVLFNKAGAFLVNRKIPRDSLDDKVVFRCPLTQPRVADLFNAIKYGSYVVDWVLMGYKSLISNEEQIFKRRARF